jgi:hypothetical protein
MITLLMRVGFGKDPFWAPRVTEILWGLFASAPPLEGECVEDDLRGLEIGSAILAC